MIKLLRKLKVSKSGASAAEYALMVALVGGVIVISVGNLGTNMKSVFTTFAAKVVTPS